MAYTGKQEPLRFPRLLMRLSYQVQIHTSSFECYTLDAKCLIMVSSVCLCSIIYNMFKLTRNWIRFIISIYFSSFCLYLLHTFALTLLVFCFYLQLTQLLKHVHRRLTSTVNSSPVTSLSPLRDTQNVLIDECCSMLQNNSSQTIQMIIHFLMILACQLCEKIGCCILHNHLSIQNGKLIVHFS